MIRSLLLRPLHQFQNDSLFRNSLYLMASTGIMAVSGFAFWIFVARIFSTHDVGIATTLISATSLLSNISLLGLNLSLIRYLPTSRDKDEKVNSSLILVSAASIITSLIFVAGLKIFSPSLLFIHTNIFYILVFTLFTILLSANTIVESIFIAHRSSGNILFKNSIYSIVKLCAPFFLTALGAYGIFSSVFIAVVVSAIIGFIILMINYAYHASFNLNRDVIKEMAFFSGGNYLSGFIGQAPSLILPLLIINLLNAEAAAYYYVSSMIVNVLSIVAQATAQSLLAEGSHDILTIKMHLKKSVGIILIFLVPAVFVIFFFGNIILHAFGKNYADEAFTFLQITAVIPIFSAFCSLGSSLLRLRHKIGELISINVVNAVITLGILYLFIPHGLVAVGWGLLLAQILITVFYAFIFWKKKLL